MRILEAIREIKKSSKRRFVQTVDLVVNLRGIDLKKPENRFTEDVVLPAGLGKELSLIVIADTTLPAAKALGLNVLSKDDLKKDVAERCVKADFILAEASLMPLVGKVLGSVLGPRGKMPIPFPPGADLAKLVARSKKTVRMRVTSNPVVHVPVGTEHMSDNALAENIKSILEALEAKVSRAKIKSVFIKLTMGPAVKVEEW